MAPDSRIIYKINKKAKMLESNTVSIPRLDNQNAMLSENTSLILILILASISAAYIVILMAFVIVRREMQPLKIKSPRLMLLSIAANLIIIASVTII